jgi:hypothetical protein
MNGRNPWGMLGGVPGSLRCQVWERVVVAFAHVEHGIVSTAIRLRGTMLLIVIVIVCTHARALAAG